MSCARCAPGYCAPQRCYCGHAECDSIDSCIPAETIHKRAMAAYLDGEATTSVMKKTWDEREESTWIDQM